MLNGDEGLTLSSSQPYIYASMYAATVVSYPEAIFVIAACLLSLAVLCLSRISPAEKDIVNLGRHDCDEEINEDDNAVP
jgi:hypothetical protein